jgi:hypothetical protein
MNSCKYIVAAFLISVFLIGCATGSMRMIGDVALYKNGGCEAVVYQTRSQAIEDGIVKEVCLIGGRSASSFDHSIEGAIKNNMDKVCQCGVTKAYVASAHTEFEMSTKGVSYVNLVGFK